MNTAERINRVLEELRAGRPIVVVDNEDRENEGDLILAAELATPQWLAFMVEHSSGYLCAPLSAQRADQLGLPLMVPDCEDPLRTAYTVSVDARVGVTTGISAADRARTVQVLAAANSTGSDLRRPGHVLPLRAVPGGVRQRPGHTEAAVELCELAGLAGVGVIGEIVSRDDPTTMARRDELDRFAGAHDLAVVSIAELVDFLDRRDQAVVVREATTTLPLAAAEFTVHGYRDTGGVEHVALTLGELNGDVLVRVHSERLTGDVFGSRRCDCGAQLETALLAISDAGAGVVVYLRGHEGRGIGLVNKLRAYRNQDRGMDTVDANTALGLPIDARDFAVAAHILDDLGVRSVRLLTNNPTKATALRAAGLSVEMVATTLHLTTHNQAYLRTKRDRLGHRLDRVDERGSGSVDRPADIRGTVVAGARRGRSLGFPTANLDVASGRELPGAGVYAAFVRLAGDDPAVRRRAAVSVGGRPTFDDPTEIVEVHLLDLDTDDELAGTTIEVWLEFYLRPILHFSSTRALVEHMTRDVAEIRELLPVQLADGSGGGR